MSEMGQGEATLSKAAGMVAEAKRDFDGLSKKLDGQIQALQGKWAGQGGQAFFQLHAAWTEKQRVVVSALDEFEQSLQTTERDNISTDEAQQANYNRNAQRLS